MSELPTIKVTYIVDTLLPEKCHDLIAIHALYGEVDDQDVGSFAESLILNRWTKEVVSREKYSQSSQVITLNEHKYSVPVSRFSQSQTLFPEKILSEILSETEKIRMHDPLTKQVLLIVTGDNVLHNVSIRKQSHLPIIHFTRNTNQPQKIITVHPNHSGIAHGFFHKISTKSELSRVKRDTIIAAPYRILKEYRGKCNGILILKDQTHSGPYTMHFSGPHLVVESADLKDIPERTYISLNSSRGEIAIIGKNAQLRSTQLTVTQKRLIRKVETEQVKFFRDLSAGSKGETPTVYGYSLLNPTELVRSVLERHRSGSFTQALIDYIMGDLRLTPRKPLVYQSLCVSLGTKNVFGKHGGQYLRESPDFFLEELEALHQLLYVYNFSDITLTIPFVRTVKELEDIKKIIARHKLTRSHKFKLFITVQVPANILQLNEYLDAGLDGVIIDLQCLTDLTLGIDSHLFRKEYRQAAHTYEFMDETFRAMRSGGVWEIDAELFRQVKLDAAINRILEHTREICRRRKTPVYLYLPDTYEEEVEQELRKQTLPHSVIPAYA